MRRTLTALVVVTTLAGSAPAALAATSTTATSTAISSTTSTSAMHWSAVTTKGGGWVTGVTASRTGDVYSRTDVGGAYRWDEASQGWRQIITSAGVPGGRAADYGVESLNVAPSNGKLVYAAVGQSVDVATGRILRSSDGGQTWTDGGARFKIDGNAAWRWGGERLAVDPANADVVLFGSRAEGLQRSEDGGRTWRRLPAPTGRSTGHDAAGVSFTLFDPKSPVRNGRTQGAWIGVQNVGVLRTDDAGQTWRLLEAVNDGVPRDADLSSSGSLFVVISGTGSRVLRISPTGSVTRIVPAAGGSFAMVAVDPANPSRVFVGDEGVRDGKLWRSTDGGATWTTLQIALSADASGRWATTAGIDQWMSGGALAFDPARPGRLWFAEGMGMWRSTDLSDAEVTWSFTSTGIEELVSTAAVKPAGKPLITASWDRGLFRHPTPGTGGATLPHRTDFGSAWDLAASPTDGNFLVAVLNDHLDVSGASNPDRKASAYSSDGGQTWTRFAALARGAAPADMMFGNIAVSARNNDNLVWAPSNLSVAKLYYTKDRGATWRAGVMQGVVPGDYIHPAYYLNREALAADPATPGRFFALGGNNTTGSAALWQTLDGGATWSKLPATGLGRHGYWDFRYNSQLVIVPATASTPQTMFALAGRTDDASRPYWKSVDGGRTWSVHAQLLDAHGFGVGAPMTPGGPPTLFTSGRVGSTPGLYRSTDMGATWVHLGRHARGWHQSVNAIVGDPEVPGKVYVGFSGGGFAVGVPGGPLPSPTTTPSTCRTAAQGPQRCRVPTVITPGSTSKLRPRTSTVVPLTATVAPRAAGMRVVLQVQGAKGWTTSSTGATKADGTVRVAYRTPASKGRATLRFVLPTADPRQPALSAPFTLSIG